MESHCSEHSGVCKALDIYEKRLDMEIESRTEGIKEIWQAIDAMRRNSQTNMRLIVAQTIGIAMLLAKELLSRMPT